MSILIAAALVEPLMVTERDGEDIALEDGRRAMTIESVVLCR